jgi:hypothetical protein
MAEVLTKVRQYARQYAVDGGDRASGRSMRARRGSCERSVRSSVPEGKEGSLVTAQVYHAPWRARWVG